MARFDVVLIDLPWPFRVWDRDTGSGRSAESHYPTMRLEDLAELPILDVCSENCAVFLWVPWPSMPDAFHIVEGWNRMAAFKKDRLEYKTLAWEWIKLNKRWKEKFTDNLVNNHLRRGFTKALFRLVHIGMGYYTRANPEPCLLFARGSVPVSTRAERNLLFAPVGEHSQKPDEQYAKIERLYPNATKLELFGRKRVGGWTVLGNEIDGKDIRYSLLEMAYE